MLGRIGEWMYQFLWLCWKVLLSMLTLNSSDTRIPAFLIMLHCTHKGQVVDNLEDEKNSEDNT